jgi:hypothetical protein
VRLASLAFLVAFPSLAVADREVAVTTNVPLRWSEASSIAGSLHVAVAKRHAIRANVISHEHQPATWQVAADILKRGEGEFGRHEGRTTDIGIGWVYYPSEMFRGFMLEVGALRRARDNRVSDDFRTPEVTARQTTTHAGRLMLGSSWVWWKHVFFAWGIGASLGRETGTETFQDRQYPPTMERTQAVHRGTFELEGYFRLGAVFRL